jgi:type I restriction enzyme S subunit
LELNICPYWVDTSLGKVAQNIVGGGTPSKNNPSFFLGSIPFMTVKDMKSIKPQDTIDHINQDAINNSSTRIIPANTPIVSTRMGLGKIVKTNYDVAINQDLKAIFLSSNIDTNYFVYWYRNIASSIEAMGKGTTVKGINISQLSSLRFLLPSLAEQKQIAYRLDALLAQVDTLKTRLDAIPTILKRFRQSVLAAAVSGKLTEGWRINKSHNAAHEIEIHKEKRAKIFQELRKIDNPLKRQANPVSLVRLPTSWCYSYIDCFLTITRSGMKTGPFGSLLKKHEHVFNGVPVIGIENISKGRFIEGSKIHITDKKADELSTYDINPNDLLISRSGSVGDICVVPSGVGKARFSTNVMRLSLIEGSLEPEFFCCQFLGGAIVLEQIKALCKGSTRLFLNQKILSSIQYPIPPLEEQTEIVRRVDQLFAFAAQIEQRVVEVRKRVNHLTQSILAKAFRGDLTAEWRAQNPELINGENSAEALLARIKAERAGVTAPGKARKQRSEA